MKKVFISYNHSDSEFVTKLSLDLTMIDGIEVVIDKWEMEIGDSILDYIEESIDESSYLLVILSNKSVNSNWVRTELKYAFYKEREIGHSFILPVKIEDCKLPIFVIDKVYINLSDTKIYEKSLQQLGDKIRSRSSFSKILRQYIKNDKIIESPYQEKYIKESKKLLIELAKYPDLDIEENQKWILWELYIEYIGNYENTWKIDFNNNKFQFLVYDRWLDITHLIELTKEDFSDGRWKIEISADETNRFNKNEMSLSKEARFIFDKSYNDFTGENPYVENRDIKSVLEKFKETLKTYESTSIESFIFSFHKLISKTINRRFIILFGRGLESHCSVESFLLVNTQHSPSGEEWLTLDVYDTFFKTLKYLTICPNHLDNKWSSDVNALSGKAEVNMSLD